MPASPSSGNPAPSPPAAPRLQPHDGGTLRSLKAASRALGPLLALVLVVICFGVANQWKNGSDSTFFTAQNARTIATPTAIIVVASLGMTLIVITGGIDLSAGTGLALCATVLASALISDRLKPWNPWAAVFLAVAAGAICGFVNGVVISSLRV